MVKSLREPILNRIARELDITGDRLGKPDESVEVQAVDALEIIENLHSLAHIYWTLCGIRFVYRHRVCEAADAVDVSGRPAATVARRHALVAIPFSWAAVDPAPPTSTWTVTVTPVRPYQPGDFVWTTSPPSLPAVGASAMDVGCDRVPATGYNGTNVYADSGAHYANHWNWGAGSSGEAYYWYVKKTDGTTQASGYTNSADSASVPANVYRWIVQNKGAYPQAWQVCFDVT